MKNLLALVPLMTLLTGCPSFTTMGTARTLPEKKGQFYIAPGYMQLSSFQRDTAANKSVSIGFPTVEFGGRYGITDRFELGGKAWFFGAELDAKLALLRSERLDSGVNVSLAPGLSYMNFTSGGTGSTHASYAWFHLPLLIGFATGGGGELTVGPRVSDMLVSSNGNTVNVVWLGGSLGYAIRIGEGMRVLPEVTFSYPASASAGGVTVTELTPKGAAIQVNLGLLFGGE
jgi:hypothetical protein